MKLCIIAVALFIVVCCPNVATATDCRDLGGHDKERLRALYYYALLAEAADTGSLPRWACEPLRGSDLGAPKVYSKGATDTAWNKNARRKLPMCNSGIQPPCIRRLATTELLEGMSQWNEIVDEFRKVGRHIGVYEPGNGGPAYIVCDNRKLDIMLFMELSEFRMPVDDSGLRGRILRPITWIVENTLIDEALEVATLQKNNELSDTTFPEQVTVIRGTRPDRLSQWQVTVNKLLGKSCVFRLMARVTGYLMSEEGWSYALTGHSLGGAVAQYVAHQAAVNSSRSHFRAFAFNAVGIEVNADPDILQSFHIEGDPVPAFGTLIGQIQAGRSVYFMPPDTDRWRITTPLDWLNRHMLRSVQQALCDCMNDMGTVIVTPEW